MTGADDARVMELDSLRSENARLRAELARLRSSVSAPQASAESPGEHPVPSGAWPSVSDVSLSTHQMERYARQIVLPSFGPKAQERVCSGSVLLVGAGGLGSPCALYLAAAGVGRLGIMDKDTVSLSNLHRQIAHREASVGVHKVDSAAAAAAALNSTVRLELHREGLTPGNAAELCAAYDVVVDCSDNAPTRYVVNDACVVARKPLVSGAAIGLEGQLTVYNLAGGPCYRCLFPECPAADACSRCDDAGVLGVVPGVIGTLQALEALKILSGVGAPLRGTLLLFDALSTRFRSVKLRERRPGCAACDSDSELRACGGPGGYDYTTFTGGQPLAEIASASQRVLAAHERVTAPHLAAEMQRLHVSGSPFVVLDVRPEVQYVASRLEGAASFPWEQLRAKKLEEFVAAAREAGPDVPKFVICRRGNDSQLAAQALLANGVANVKDVIGGMTAWSQEVDGNVPLL